MTSPIFTFHPPHSKARVVIDLTQLQMLRLFAPVVHTPENTPDSVSVKFDMKLILRGGVTPQPIEWVVAGVDPRFVDEVIAEADAEVAALRRAWEATRPARAPHHPSGEGPYVTPG